jgi:hypothetical protein
VTDIALVRGQTVSDLLQIQFDNPVVIAAPFTLCFRMLLSFRLTSFLPLLDVRTDIPLDHTFGVYDLGILRSNPTRVVALGLQLQVIVTNTSNTTSTLVCGNVTEAGIIIAYLFVVLIFMFFDTLLKV